MRPDPHDQPAAASPHAASSNVNPMAVEIVSFAPGTAAKTSVNPRVPNEANMIIMATANPMSPTRLTTNAFFAAVAVVGLYCQNPMSKYDARPTPSHPRYTSR